jgi:hypothetical protein
MQIVLQALLSLLVVGIPGELRKYKSMHPGVYIFIKSEDITVISRHFIT